MCYVLWHGDNLIAHAVGILLERQSRCKAYTTAVPYSDHRQSLLHRIYTYIRAGQLSNQHLLCCGTHSLDRPQKLLSR